MGIEYGHVFLFRCHACHGALTSACFTSESNLEMADEHIFRHTCDCGWTGELTGFMAREPLGAILGSGRIER